LVPEAGAVATAGLAAGFDGSVGEDVLLFPVEGVDDVAAPELPPAPAAAADSFPAEPLLLPVELELEPQELEIMLTELTLRMFCAVPLMEPLGPLEAAPGACVPLPTVPETATW
jgi:hypothetical protein